MSAPPPQDGTPAAPGAAPANPVEALLRDKRVLVLCGAGGVGKTTVSAALALAAAHSGRRALVLTIDPARRLAEALGIPAHASHPTPVPRDRLAAAGVAAGGELDAWMLDPAVVFENLIHKLASPDSARAILETRLYRHLTELVAGMQEYTAAEALYELSREERYDLIVLDTPPSPSALDFLDAPGRLSGFLDGQIVQLFLPSHGGGLLRRAGRLVGSVFARAFGEQFILDLQTFLSAFSGTFGALRSHTAGVKELLESAKTAFLLVTSPAEAAVREALYFRDQILARSLPFEGFVLNRSLARGRELLHPETFAAEARVAEARDALRKLGIFAERERVQGDKDAALLERLAALAGPGRFAVAAPHLGDAVDDLPGLLQLAAGLSS
ncbi:MAG TPA: ArsA-related P-loop ATPase [Myxococcales bacterium]|nr:ArsA-related P-loop ATPase [Myxococcales bacterium]